jgi:hypothetical protein
MPVGDLLKRIALGETLSPSDAEKVRLWGNQSEGLDAFTSGLQTGNSDMTVGTINARFGNYDVPPLNTSFFGSDWLAASWPQTLTNNTDTQLTTVFEDSRVNPQSIISWYDESNYLFQISPAFSKTTPLVAYFFGNWLWQNASSTYRELSIIWKRKSDDTTYKTVAIYSNDEASWCGPFGNLIQFNDFDEDPATLYFQINAKHIAGTDQGLQFFCCFQRIL